MTQEENEVLILEQEGWAQVTWSVAGAEPGTQEGQRLLLDHPSLEMGAC